MFHPDKKQEAIILKVTNYGESDKILTLFLKESGKRSAIAKGALKSQRRFGSVLELGHLLEVVCKETPHRDWLFLQEASLLERNPPWRGFWNGIVIVSYCLELAARLLPEGQEAQPKFILLKNFLFSLREETAATSLLDFQLSWLSLCGWHPDLEVCGVCGKKWKFKEGGNQIIFDHYWEHILGKPLVSRRLLEKLF